jgi:cytidylate kinase
MSFQIIAIDGGAASGKSSTSRAVAQKLGLMHVDTGQHYRMLTYVFLKNTVPVEDIPQIKTFLNHQTLDTHIEDGHALMVESGIEHIGPHELKSLEVNATVSLYAAIPEVRHFVLGYQRNLVDLASQKGYKGIIMEGRDIGSVVLPHADLKFFLYADLEKRNQRRILEGRPDSIAERDRLDSQRKTAPLVCPGDAIRIDNSDLTLDEVVTQICDIIRDKNNVTNNT